MIKILLCCYLISSTVVQAQSCTMSYISDNIYINKEFKVIISGSISCLNGNKDINKALLTYLNKEFGISNVIEALPASYTYFINIYNKTSDDSIISFLFNNLISFEIKCPNRLLEFIELKEELPCITYYGIELENNDLVTYFALKDIIRDVKLPDELNPLVSLIDEVIQTKKPLRKHKALEFSSKLKYIIENNEQEYKSMLGKKYFEFQMIVYGLYTSLKYPLKKAGQINFNYREELMYKNVIELMKKYPRELFFAKLNEFHICKEKVIKWIWLKDWESLAAKLNTRADSPARDAVITIAYYLRLDSIKEDDFYNFGILNSELRKELFNDSEERYSIYKMCDTNSKFYTYCDVFDYLIIDRYWSLK